MFTKKSFRHFRGVEEGLFNAKTDTAAEPHGKSAKENRLAAVQRAIRLLSPSYEHVGNLSQLLVDLSPNPLVSVAILMQESGFRDVHVTVQGFDTRTGELTNVYKDLGIAQINAGTIEGFHCNRSLIIAHDLHESIRCHSIVLAAKMEMCKDLGSVSWRCYNSSISKYGIQYQKAVERHLRRIVK